LQKRYRKLVQQHLGAAEDVAAGLRILPGTASAWAATQGAWRFYHNPRVRLPELAEPLLLQAVTACAAECQAYALVMHDWSRLGYKRHGGKQGRIPLVRSDDLGYELQSALLVSDQSGAPLAPLYMGVRDAHGVRSSRRATPLPPRSHLDELSRTMGYTEAVGLSKPVVHIVDREADAVRQVRRWQRRERLFVIRAQDIRLVHHAGREVHLSTVVTKLQEQFARSRAVDYRGRHAVQYVAETEVVLHRPAKVRRPQTRGRQRQYVSGVPLPLRLIVSQVRTVDGRLLAQWLLWTNLPPVVDAGTVALWYYWRWRIESFFKLLKSAGQHVEQWQQENAEAIAKRLLVAAQACVLVWALARTTLPAAEPTRTLLIRLSGRLMKRHRPYTAPALLAGLWVLLAMLAVLEEYPVADLRRLAAHALPVWQPPAKG
jgi:hypothetical protein